MFNFSPVRHLKGQACHRPGQKAGPIIKAEPWRSRNPGLQRWSISPGASALEHQRWSISAVEHPALNAISRRLSSGIVARWTMGSAPTQTNGKLTLFVLVLCTPCHQGVRLGIPYSLVIDSRVLYNEAQWKG